MEKQSTIAQSISLSGSGLHSGKEVFITFKPAPENHGIIFQRVDLENSPLIHAAPHNVYDTSRGTSIRENGAEVMTVEHLLAALAGLSIDNVLVEINNAETPILDGSAKIYVDTLRQAGTVSQNAPREYIVIDKEYTFRKPDTDIEVTVKPCDHYKMSVNVDYGTTVLAAQEASINGMEDFLAHIYESRTFVFLHELQFLIAHNLAKGGDVDNAIVFVDKKPSQEVLDELARFFNKKDIDVTENGTLNHQPLRFANEPARHKLLDLVGDLYLLGKPIKGHITANKPGHFANTELAKIIERELLIGID